jgi:hypothetical protein
MAAEYQVENEYFVTLVVMPTKDFKGSTEGYQVSDAAVKLVKGRYLVDTDRPNTLCFTEDLKFCQIRRREITGSELNLLLTPIRVRATARPRAPFRRDSFPPLSSSPSRLTLATYLQDNKACPNWHLLFDFDLLVYLVFRNLVHQGDELTQLIDAIVGMKEVSPALMDRIRADAKKA